MVKSARPGVAWSRISSELLRDGHGRVIGDLRVSVTDRCNFRCQYCMPAEGLPWLERAEILRFEEIARLVSMFASMGVGEVRLTGGEPLVRREFPKLVVDAARLPDLHELSVTTNGFLLGRDAEALVRAGVDRFNVSVDSLQRDRFYELTRRDALAQVLAGLEGLASFPEAHPIKIDAVAIRGFTEDEVLPFARVRPRDARTRSASSSSCRSTPTAAGHRSGADRSRDPRRDRRGYPLEPEPREPIATAGLPVRRRPRPDRVHRPGLRAVLPRCNRVRLTAEGQLRTCLFS